MQFSNHWHINGLSEWSLCVNTMISRTWSRSYFSDPVSWIFEQSMRHRFENHKIIWFFVTTLCSFLVNFTDLSSEWQHMVMTWNYVTTRGVVGRERVGTAFPHLIHVLLWNEWDAVSKWLFFWMRSHTFFVSTTSLLYKPLRFATTKPLMPRKYTNPVSTKFIISLLQWEKENVNFMRFLLTARKQLRVLYFHLYCCSSSSFLIRF